MAEGKRIVCFLRIAWVEAGSGAAGGEPEESAASNEWVICLVLDVTIMGR